MTTPATRIWPALLAALLLWTGCDTVEPGGDTRLVVEAFLDAGRPAPPLILRRTAALGDPVADRPAEAATVHLTLDGVPVPYAPDPARPGQYVPAARPPLVPPRARYDLRVDWRDQTATAGGTVPPPIHLDSVRLRIPARPVRAILLDSLDFGLDSLNVDVDARQGFIYPVEVTLWWRVGFDEAGPDSAYWVQTRLRPRQGFSSRLIDFFLLPEAVFRERDVPQDGAGRRAWTGVYAVPVDDEADPLPVHGLTVALLRSGQDYARFVTSRDAPERREPRSNVTGALGIVAGLSVDSLFVEVTGPASVRH